MRGTEPAQPALFEPGPLAAVAILPRRIAVPPGCERRVQARPVDADGRRQFATAIDLEWSIDHPGFTIRGRGAASRGRGGG